MGFGETRLDGIWDKRLNKDYRRGLGNLKEKVQEETVGPNGGDSLGERDTPSETTLRPVCTLLVG